MYPPLSYTTLLLAMLGLWATSVYATPPSSAVPSGISTPAPLTLPSPLTLDDALSYALAHNPQLRIVQQQLKEQQGILVQTFSRAVPNITASATAGLNDSALYETELARTGGRKTWTAGFTLSQTLFAGGSVVSSIRADYARSQAARARVTSAIEATVYSVKQSFYQILINRQIISVRAEDLQVLEEQLKDVEARYNAGLASQFELLQAQVAVANARPQLIRARNDYRVATQSLQAILGTPPTLELNPDDIQGTISTDAIGIDIERVHLTDLLASAEANRADIRAANRDYAAAQSNVWSARGEYLPRVDLVGGYGWQKSSLITQVDENIVNGWNIGVQASMPIFDGLRSAAAVYSAKARKRQASAAELQTRLAVSVEVRQAYSAFDQAREILNSAQQVVDQARESLRMAKARYQAGSSTQLDVLQSQSALSQARLSLLQAQYDYIVAIADLQRATGTHDWVLQDHTPTP